VVGFTSSLNDQKMGKVILEIQETIHEIGDSMRNHPSLTPPFSSKRRAIS
jgi:hypothetical protein